jgi:succinoglycan biosynthesis transport protein ExoP
MDTNTLPGRGIKPLLSLRKHYRISIVIWLAVVLAGLPVAWIKGKSYYYTESVFQVSPNYMKTLTADEEVEFQSNSQYREYVNHLSNTIRRYDVIGLALKKLREQQIDIQPKGMTERKFNEQLQKDLLIRAIPDTYMVRIGLQGPEKEALDEIVNAVMQAFLDVTKDEQIYGSADRLEALQATGQTLLGEISQLEAQRLELTEPLGLTTFGENTSNPYDGMLAQAREKLTAASIERIQAEATLQAFLQQRETPTTAGRSILDMRLQDNGLQALRNVIINRSEELSRLTAGLEDKHPAKQPALVEQAAIKERLQSREFEFDQAAFENIRNRLQASVQQSRQVEQDVLQKMQSIEGQAVDFARNFQLAMRLTNDIKKREQEYKDVRDRVIYLQNESQAIGFVRLVTPALPAITPMGVGKTKLLLMILVVATGLALVAPVALDMLDRRLYTVNDAEKLLGMPAAGWQIEITDLPSKLYAKEQTRRFASTLMRDKSRTGQGVFAFMALKSDERPMAAILDTAVELQRLGWRALVVDANSFKPSPLFRSDHFGLTDYLSGDVEATELLLQAYHHDDAVNVVGFGTQRAFGIQRLDRLKLLVEHWHSAYDFVLIDLPPLLLSADAELLVGALGQVFMVVEAQSVNKGEVSRAKRMLEKLDPEAVGLFVDNVPLFREPASGYLHEVMLETITKTSPKKFMTLPGLKLQYELLRVRWAIWRSRKPQPERKSS